MFSVLFEVHPKTEQWDAYLGYAKLLRPELVRVNGFVDNIRYRSLSREGWILSLSNWRDEKALVRWRTQAMHHDVQEKGRHEVLLDYHLRVGQLTQDTRLPADHALHEERLDETETGEATTVVLIDAKRPKEWVEKTCHEDVAKWLGLKPGAKGFVSWDVFDAVLTPGDVIHLTSWRDHVAAEAFEAATKLQEGAGLCRVRVVRDYGIFDRRGIRTHPKPEDREATMIRTTCPLSLFAAMTLVLGLDGPASAQQPVEVLHKTLKVGDLDIFYREAGPKDAPTLLLLHGFPTSSQMFRRLIPSLADKFHVVAPDYPGFGHSSMPSRDEFSYTFDNLSKTIDDFTGKVGLTKYALYLQDYGGPVGYRLAVAHPERITAIVVQNGNAYDEGLDNDFWKPMKAYWKDPNSREKRDALRGFLKYDATKWRYTHGVKNTELVSPDGAAHDQFLLDRKGNDEIQLDLFLSYGSNPPLYPKWQAYFREHQPPVLIVWGKNDQIFPAAGAEPYKRDLKSLEYHLLDAGHFALETNGDEIAWLIREFLGKQIVAK